jgi:glucokinase
MTVIGALDIGGSKILAGLARTDGQILATHRLRLMERSPAHVTLQAAEMLRALADAHHARLRGVGCSVPGPLDPRSGVIRFSPNLGWRRVALARMLRQRLRVPVVIDDDARCAAIGEWWRGSGRGARWLLYLVVGTGVGGGLVLDGKIIRGANDSAGEIGHTIVQPASRRRGWSRAR